jgi:hemoglobin-like flavoprotein
MALIVVESHFTHSYPATTHYLHVLGHRHHQSGIPPEHFPKFRDCLLETLAEFHAESWSPDLAAAWRAAIDLAAGTMLEGYERAYTY